MKTIEYKSCIYPEFQSKGFASQFAIPYAKHFCIGEGYDIGCGNLEWAFPKAFPIDPKINEFHALSLPDKTVDYIFSSHCLEHLDDWVGVLDYWGTKIRSGGILFLYLPDFSQEYWRPWNNRKHKNILSPHILSEYLRSNNYKNIFCSGIDLNNSFMVVGERN